MKASFDSGASEAQPGAAGLASTPGSAPSLAVECQKLPESAGHESCETGVVDLARSAPAKRSKADIPKATALARMAYNLMEVAQFLLKAAEAAPAVGQPAESERERATEPNS